MLDCALSVVPPPPSGKKGAKGVQTVAAPEWEVILMDTVIFPEGGGQPSDVGTLTFVNEGVSIVVKVRQVLRRGLEAVHFCDAPIEVGSLVTAALDWDRRVDLMSMHTGQQYVHESVASARSHVRQPAVRCSRHARPADALVVPHSVPAAMLH